MLVQLILGVPLILLGLVFMFLGGIGVIRLPDFYTRTHAASKVDTVGVVLVLFGVAVIEGLTLTTVKVLLAAFFILLTNPVSVHALGRAALRQGLIPWRRGEPVDTQMPRPED